MIVKMEKEEIERIFKESETQGEVLIKLYTLIFPDFKERESINHTKCSNELWVYICDLFVKFDQEQHPDVLNGGLWLNRGFSISEQVKGMQVKREK